MQFEDYCCFAAAYELRLPYTWREENVRIRHKIAIVEYPLLADDERKARILDDVWAEFLAIVPRLADVTYKVPKLKTLNAEKRTEVASELHTMLNHYDETLEQFINLPHVLEVLEPATFSSSHISKHADCCPTPPFIPYALQFPPSGVFRIVVFAMKCYIQSVLRPPVLIACGLEAEILETDTSHAIEVCRTYAGVEDALGDSPDSCLPLFSALILVISTCPQELRLWFWYKLAHFEQQGLATFENPIRKNYAKLWNISDIRPQLKGLSELLSTRDNIEDVVEPEL